MSHYIKPSPSIPVQVPLQVPLQTWLVQNVPCYNPQTDPIKPILLGSRFANLASSPYFRITIAGNTEIRQIVVNVVPKSTPIASTPLAETNEVATTFLNISRLLTDAGINAPKLMAQDVTQGFFVFSDLGEQTCFDALTSENADSLLRPAADTLIRWQLSSKPNTLPTLDAARLSAELGLFSDCYLGQHLGISLTAAQQKTLASVFANIVAANLGQQNVFIHGDFVPQNLIISDQGIALKPFTGAAFGPIAYDIASLYKDVFKSFDEEPILDGTIRYWEKARKAGLPVPNDFGDFYRDVEWMGLQRHLYLLGVFAQLARQQPLKDENGALAYIDDAIRFVRYIRKVGERYTALFPLIRLFDALKIDDGMKRSVGVSF